MSYNPEYYKKNKDRFRKYHETYLKNHRESRKKYLHDRYEKIREEVFNHYGGCFCKCCGETEIAFLTIDHINGGGNAHRKGLKDKSSIIYLKRIGFPLGFQVLCWNCNAGKYKNGGICPHKTKGKEFIT